MEAIDVAFAGFVDYAILNKVYGFPMEHETRYSPAQCIGCESRRVVGILTRSRQNWTVRTNNRRYTRLSNGFSRKLENHAASVVA